jgi:hypothetical protein
MINADSDRPYCCPDCICGHHGNCRARRCSCRLRNHNEGFGTAADIEILAAHLWRRTRIVPNITVAAAIKFKEKLA